LNFPHLFTLALAFAFAFGFPSPGGAETPPAGGPTATAPANPLATPLMNPMGPRTRNGLDDGFFEDKKEAEAGVKVGSDGIPLSQSGRYLGAEPDYNSQDREDWISECEPARQQGTKAFRECFAAKKKQAAQTLREKFDAVEKRQGQTLKDIPTPLMDEGREPAGDD
jgi:hypothetical protein